MSDTRNHKNSEKNIDLDWDFCRESTDESLTSQNSNNSTNESIICVIDQPNVDFVDNIEKNYSKEKLNNINAESEVNDIKMETKSLSLQNEDLKDKIIDNKKDQTEIKASEPIKQTFTEQNENTENQKIPEDTKKDTHMVEDIRDLKINDILDILKTKKMDISELRGRNKVDFSKNHENSVFTLIKERNMDLDFIKEQKIKTDFYKMEQKKIYAAPKVSIEDMIKANQSDVQIMLNSVKTKNKGFMDTISDNYY